MIPTQAIVTSMLTRIQDELGLRYTFEEDLRDSINSAVDWMVMVFNSALGNKKLSGEVLREISLVRIWQASPLNRIEFREADMGHKMWTILNVMPNPLVDGDASPLPPLNVSRYRGDLRFIRSPHSAKRLSSEQWNDAIGNPFMAGGPAINPGLVEYAYLDESNYSSTSLNTGVEIEVSPDVPGAARLVAVRYVRQPSRVNAITDEIELPSQVQQLLVLKALSFASIKEGDGTTLYSVSERDVASLVQTMAP